MNKYKVPEQPKFGELGLRNTSEKIAEKFPRVSSRSFFVFFVAKSVRFKGAVRETFKRKRDFLRIMSKNGCSVRRQNIANARVYTD
jgi:hypothetical protein